MAIKFIYLTLIISAALSFAESSSSPCEFHVVDKTAYGLLGFAYGGTERLEIESEGSASIMVTGNASDLKKLRKAVKQNGGRFLVEKLGSSFLMEWQNFWGNYHHAVIGSNGKVLKTFDTLNPNFRAFAQTDGSALIFTDTWVDDVGSSLGLYYVTADGLTIQDHIAGGERMKLARSPSTLVVYHVASLDIYVALILSSAGYPYYRLKAASFKANGELIGQVQYLSFPDVNRGFIPALVTDDAGNIAIEVKRPSYTVSNSERNILIGMALGGVAGGILGSTMSSSRRVGERVVYVAIKEDGSLRVAD